jgi:hypothetical protein
MKKAVLFPRAFQIYGCSADTNLPNSFLLFEEEGIPPQRKADALLLAAGFLIDRISLTFHTIV